jgi:hypothetical protein
MTSEPHCKFCDKAVTARGMCHGHWRKYSEGKRGAELSAPLRPYRAEPIDMTGTEPLADKIRSYLLKSKHPHTIEQLSDRYDVGISKIKEAVTLLEQDGINIIIGNDIELPKSMPSKREITRIDVSKFNGESFEFAFTADNHLCSKYYRDDVLNALYDDWEARGITRVLQGGNMIDGEARFNKFDLLTRPGLDAQAEYLVNEWPQRKGMTTEFVCGDDHEGWYVQREGVNIVKYLQNAADNAGRSDMKFLGYMEHDFELKGKTGSSIMRLIHAGGGSAYATSYSVQKIVESYQPNEKPTILLAGHFHKAEYGYPRAVHCVQGGCTEDQTPFMRKKRIEAMVGGWIIKFQVDANGIVHRFNQEFQPFYDRDFYHKWKYHWK